MNIQLKLYRINNLFFKPVIIKENTTYAIQVNAETVFHVRWYFHQKEHKCPVTPNMSYTNCVKWYCGQNLAPRDWHVRFL